MRQLHYTELLMQLDQGFSFGIFWVCKRFVQMAPLIPLKTITLTLNNRTENQHLRLRNLDLLKGLICTTLVGLGYH